MDDLISRQVFDKFLKDAEEEAIKKRKYVFASALNTIRGNLREFPSAQPEREGETKDDFDELIKASDLIEWIMETYPDWCIGDIRSIVDHINNMPTQTNTFNVLETSDCISRHVAIDALVKAIREDPYYDSNEAINGLGVCDVRVILNDLPSAQPDWNEMIVICDCCGHTIHVKRQ